jgi:hypothetical protein
MTKSPLSGIIRAVAAILCRIRPLSLDGPGAEALMVWVVAGKVAVFDQAAGGVTAAVVDVFVLTHAECCFILSQYVVCKDS